MSYGRFGKEFFSAIRTPPENRSEKDCSNICLGLRQLDCLAGCNEKEARRIASIARYEFHDADEMLFKKNDLCYCWYILLTGSVFIQGSMFLPYKSFGKKLPGTKRRSSQCLVLESSEMLAVDYPDITIHTTSGGLTTRQQNSRTTNDNSVGGANIIEVESSSSESSPLRHPKRNTLPKVSGSQLALINDNESQSSILSKDMDEDEDYIEPEDDTISLQSSSSFHIKDLVIEVLKREPDARTADDIEMLMEFTKSLVAFSNMTESVRKSLCKAMVFAWVEHADTVVLNDNELLDSWSVIVNGEVQIVTKDEDDEDETILKMGETFGVEPTLDKQYHKGVMTTLTDDCQFLCIPQTVYCHLVQMGKENIEFITDESGDVVMVKEKREYDNGAKSGTILIRGTAFSLTRHMLEENALDATYIEDFLLTYRAFIAEPLTIFQDLLKWFENIYYREKVSRIILLWVNNHFNDFERDVKMMRLLEEFDKRLALHNLQGQSKFLSMACMNKAKSRVVSLTRPSSDVALCFEITGGVSSQGSYQPIYIASVVDGSVAEKKGIKRGDQLLEVNGQNFEKILFEKALSILNKNTELNLTIKTNLFGYKEVVTNQQTNNRRSRKHHSLREDRQSNHNNSDNEVFDGKHKKGGGTIGRTTFKLSRIFKKSSNNFDDFVARHGGSVTVDDTFLTIPRKGAHGNSATIDAPQSNFRHSVNLSRSDPDLLSDSSSNVEFLNLPVSDIPEDIIKVYKEDQTHCFLFVNEDTTAGDVVGKACREFGITEDLEEYALYRVSVQSETSVKQSKLPDPWSKLAEIPLGARYYLKKSTYSEQLLPDENIPDLLKEANFSFLDLNCFEVALHLTREDYKLFQLTEPTNFIDDLFHRDIELEEFKNFEDLVNRELFWVVTTICKESSAIQRAKIIKHFTKIAHQCKILKNFNSTFALVSGLGYRAITRMKQAWEKVPSKSTRLFEELQALMDPSRNMSKYRTLLNDYIQQPPVIPYIPVVKKDLTFLHLGNDTKVNGLINFEKMRMIAKEVRNVCRLCAPDKSHIIPSATASLQKESDKGAIYHTLARRGRRSSFSNLKKMYEDQMNVRRVRQYMKQISIITDEGKLMELSKVAEPPTGPSSAQTKRRNTAIATDSPTRSSKTLPYQHARSNSSSASGNLQSRNNSEPHLATIPAITIQPTKKKYPSTTLPNHGKESPQMISKKLMSLSEESGVDDRKGRVKKIKESKRSASVSSYEISPSSSPFMTPKHNSEMKTHLDLNHTVASENTNRNNNRSSLPPGSAITSSNDPSFVYVHGAHRKTLPQFGTSAASSCRSSIASASSLGTMSSNPSLVGNGGSPGSSSPDLYGSNPSLTSNYPPTIVTLHSSSNSPSRSASGSSTDTVKSTVGRLIPHERPVIKHTRNNRSISYGGGSMLPTSSNDRILTQISASSSSPALNVSRAQPSSILPSHPRIPRTPSVDSGVLSSCSLSVDSVRYNLTEEGESFQSNPQLSDSALARSQPVRSTETQSGRRSAEINLTSVSNRTGNHPSQSTAENHKVEQTFLSGYRGPWDTPRPDIKDPINSTGSNPYSLVDLKKLPIDAIIHPGHIPPGSKQYQHRPVLGKGSVKGIQEFLICERKSSTRNYGYLRASFNSNNNNYNPVMQPNFTKIAHTAVPDAALEEQLRMELVKQKPTGHIAKRPNYLFPENSINLASLKRLSLGKYDSTRNDYYLWQNFTSNLKQDQTSNSPHIPSPNIDNPPSSFSQSTSVYHHPPSPVTPAYHGSLYQSFNPSPQSSKGSSLSISASHHRLNKTEVLAMSAYDAMQQNPGWRLGGIEASIQNDSPHNFVYNSTESVTTSESNSFHNHKRLSTHFPSPGSNRSFGTYVEHSFTDETQNLSVTDVSENRSEARINSHCSFYSGRQSEAFFPQRTVEMYSVEHRRKSQDWNETDLDVGERHQQAIKAWGSNTSLPITSTSSRIYSQSRELPPKNLHPDLLFYKSPEKKTNKLPPPPPPQRTSSRPHFKNISRSSSSDSFPSTVDAEELNEGSRVKVNGHVPCSHPIKPLESSNLHSNANHSRKSLPTYDEALHQIHAKHSNSIYSSSLKNSYKSFSPDGGDKKEQISQV